MISQLRRAGAAVAVLAAVAAGECFARDWYVATNGTDAAAGTLTEPTTLFSALNRAGTGDSVIVRGGQYDLSRQVFLNQANMTLRGYGAERAVLAMPTNDPALASVVWPYAPGCVLEGLEIAGGYYYGVKMDYPDCTVRDCIVRDTGRDGIKIARPADRCVIENCEIFNTGKRDASNAEGIDNVACDDVVVRRCHIHHTATNGVYMKGGAARCVIEKNLVTDISGHGIMLGQSTDAGLMTSDYECRDSIARNNVVLRTQGAGLAFESASNCRVINNTCYDVATTYSGGITVRANEHHTRSKDVDASNNIVVVLSNRPHVFVTPEGLASAADMTCDRNLYYRPSGSYAFWFEPTSVYASSLEAWRAATPYDGTSACAAPQFAGPGLP